MSNPPSQALQALGRAADKFVEAEDRLDAARRGGSTAAARVELFRMQQEALTGLWAAARIYGARPRRNAA